MILGGDDLPRITRRYRSIVDAVDAVRTEIASLSDDCSPGSKTARRREALGGRLKAARGDLDRAAVDVAECARVTRPQLVKELAASALVKVGRRGDVAFADLAVRCALEVLARLELNRHVELLECGTVAPPLDLDAYAQPNVILALAEAVAASTKAHGRLARDEREKRDAQRLQKLKRKHPKATLTHLRQGQRRTASGTTTPDHFVWLAARAAGATTAGTPGAYQSRVRAALKDCLR